jgi:two-component system heavy metal sensor histidine kinase CusS
MLSKWHFLYRHDAGNFVIFLDNHQEYESVERFAEGFLVALLLALVLAIPSGYLYSRRILTPLRMVRAGLTQIRAGQLQARIADEALSEELRSLVNGLNETFSELEEAFSRSSDFSAAAAHELKTPLTAMRGNLEVALGKPRSQEEYQAVLADALEQTVVLARIVDQLLLLASPERAAKSRDLDIVSLSEAVADILTVCQAAAEEKGIDVRLKILSDAQIEVNRDLLARMLHNLVHNAVKFSEPGASVNIHIDREDTHAVIEVQDHGPGIAPENRDRIFDRFFQADPSRNSGRGLGLAIVKWIVNYHAGNITVESTPGEGATFRVTLPLRQEHGPAGDSPANKPG